MKMKKITYKIMKHINCFYKENKMLSHLSLGAIGFVLFYYFSYDIPEIWKNASVFVDILFQLSLAILANLLFFIFQVYIPNYKRNYRIRPVIIRKIGCICEFMNDPFLEITEKYLEHKKNLNELSDDDIQKIAEKYRPHDVSTVQVAFVCCNLTYDQYFKYSFEEMDNIIQELLFAYEPYLNNEERDILLLIKENSFRRLFDSPIMSLFDSTGIQGNAVYSTFSQYKNIYQKLLELVTEK